MLQGAGTCQQNEHPTLRILVLSSNTVYDPIDKCEAACVVAWPKQYAAIPAYIFCT